MPEDPTEPPDSIRMVDAFPLDRLATAQQRADSMGFSALYMHRIEPSRPKHIGNPARVSLVTHADSAAITCRASM